MNAGIQEQLRQLKHEVVGRIEVIKKQINSSQGDLVEISEFVKNELSSVLEELTRLSKEIRDDVGQITVKHKDQLTETFKRSKENTVEAWNKVSGKQ